MDSNSRLWNLRNGMARRVIYESILRRSIDTQAVLHYRIRSESRAGFTIIEALVVVSVVALLVALLLPGIQAAREAARRTQCLNNFRQIGFATSNFMSARGDYLPADRPVEDEIGSGRVLPLSWMFSLLPFLEASEIHQAYDPGQSWLSETDQNVMAKTVPVFQCPSTPGSPARTMRNAEEMEPRIPQLGTTDIMGTRLTFKVIADGKERKTLWAPGSLLGSNIDRGTFKPAHARQITDGLSKTSVAAEKAGTPTRYSAKAGSRHVPVGDVNRERCYQVSRPRSSVKDYYVRFTVGAWGVNLGHDAIDSKATVNQDNCHGLYGFHPSGAHIAMVDASVRFVSHQTESKVIEAMATRSGSNYRTDR